MKDSRLLTIFLGLVYLCYLLGFAFTLSHVFFYSSLEYSRIEEVSLDHQLFICTLDLEYVFPSKWFIYFKLCLCFLIHFQQTHPDLVTSKICANSQVWGKRNKKKLKLIKSEPVPWSRPPWCSQGPGCPAPCQQLLPCFITSVCLDVFPMRLWSSSGDARSSVQFAEWSNEPSTQGWIMKRKDVKYGQGEY